jgi:hypothetical protein
VRKIKDKRLAASFAPLKIMAKNVGRLAWRNRPTEPPIGRLRYTNRPYLLAGIAASLLTLQNQG